MFPQYLQKIIKNNEASSFFKNSCLFKIFCYFLLALQSGGVFIGK